VVPGAYLDTGGRYDPAGSGSWSPTTTDGAPSARRAPTAVWGETEMIVIGGYPPANSYGSYCGCAEGFSYFRDGDGDGRGDPAGRVGSCASQPPPGYVPDGSDCDDGQASVWSAPGEVRDLSLAPGKETLTWQPPADPGGAVEELLYDTLRSDEPADFGAPAICVASDAPATSTRDPVDPPPGAAFAYLVRAQNACPDGQGTLGAGSGGAPRAGRACP
jgi:hypothetical protein